MEMKDGRLHQPTHLRRWPPLLVKWILIGRRSSQSGLRITQEQPSDPSCSAYQTDAPARGVQEGRAELPKWQQNPQGWRTSFAGPTPANAIENVIHKPLDRREEVDNRRLKDNVTYVLQASKKIDRSQAPRVQERYEWYHNKCETLQWLSSTAVYRDRGE